jgi:hypothetical protein
MAPMVKYFFREGTININKTLDYHAPKAPHNKKPLDTIGIKGLLAINTWTCIARAPKGALAYGTYPIQFLWLLQSE